MSERGDSTLLQDIEEAVRRIDEYAQSVTFGQFKKDIKTQDAVVRNLEIIGEAVKNISSTFKRKHPEVDWKNIAGLRDRLIHDYFGVNWDIVWDVVKTKVPELGRRVEDFLRESKG